MHLDYNSIHLEHNSTPLGA